MARLDLQSMAQLQTLTLRSILPEGIALREGVHVRLHGFDSPKTYSKPVWQGVHVQHINYQKKKYGGSTSSQYAGSGSQAR